MAELTPHPFVRTGVRVVALLTGRNHPGQVTEADLDTAAHWIADAAAVGAAAEKDGPGWAITQRLACCYPNSAPVHPTRSKRTVPVAERVLHDYLGPDDLDGETWQCWTCGAPASKRTGKMTWPLLDAPRRSRGGSPDRGEGWPACRACRIAVWAMPYGAGYHAGLMHTLGQAAEEVEAAVVRAEWDVARRGVDERWAAWPKTPHPDDVVATALRSAGAASGLRLDRWKNGNQEATMRSSVLDSSLAQWLAAALREGHGPLIQEARGRTPVLEWAAAQDRVAGTLRRVATSSQQPSVREACADLAYGHAQASGTACSDTHAAGLLLAALSRHSPAGRDVAACVATPRPSRAAAASGPARDLLALAYHSPTRRAVHSDPIRVDSEVLVREVGEHLAHLVDGARHPVSRLARLCHDLTDPEPEPEKLNRSLRGDHIPAEVLALLEHEEDGYYQDLLLHSVLGALARLGWEGDPGAARRTGTTLAPELEPAAAASQPPRA
ncbi:hypothetical protein [Streptomyces sp. SM12]|uniref:hypothetical protein n=1 Tax=Streptomyces sp. SM12 TaxID=1071602 RepID=UPI000CD4CFEE|nr:hypothetical protein [Streptomyces sp. SM12]